jgi:hypothetical protein
MAKNDWQDVLRNHFDNVKVLEKSKGETVNQFNQFCEFIVEPAFENLADELASYGVKARHRTFKGRDTRLTINFPRSRDAQFEYRISLPRNSIEVRPALLIRGRRNLKADYKTTEKGFMPTRSSAEILKLDKEAVILDVIEHYRNFIYESLTAPE